MLACGPLMARHALSSGIRNSNRMLLTSRVLPSNSTRLGSRWQLHRSSFPPSWGAPRKNFGLQRKQYHSGGGYGGSSGGISSESVIFGLIGVNGLVFMLWQGADTPTTRSRMIQNFTTSEGHLRHGAWHTLVTCTFSHMNLSHLAFNMFGLYFFGHSMCQLLGPRRFLVLYLTSGAFSSLAAVAEQMYSNRYSFNLGASGAVNALTALTVMCFPHATFLIFGIVPMPAYLAGSLFIGKDFYSWWKGENDGVGHFAHLSGAFYGAGYYYYLRRAARAAAKRY